MRGSALVDPARLAIPIETHRRLRIGARRSIPEAEGKIRHSQKEISFVPQLFRGVRTDARLQTLHAGWRVASESRANVNAVKRSALQHNSIMLILPSVTTPA